MKFIFHFLGVLKKKFRCGNPILEKFTVVRVYPPPGSVADETERGENFPVEKKVVKNTIGYEHEIQKTP